jgi:S-adenosylmethionine:diacylglycerol 3-amino-3-carboxypropyl transferase
MSEQFALDIQCQDRILSLASGGEVSFSFLSLNENIQLKAVDISEQQIMLCRLKLAAAQHLDFPVNAHFLGYAKLKLSDRRELYQSIIRPNLLAEDVLFWDKNIRFIENGVVNGGRFEQYIKKMRFVADLIIGRKNIQRLIECQSIEEQKTVFHDLIEPRKSLQLLFKIAFHPVIYKKRGLQEQALIHAGKSTGDRFYGRFQDFCTSNLAAENYFLQYFLTGNCAVEKSFPEYLRPENKERLLHNLNRFELEINSLQKVLVEKGKGYFNKIHLSNVGDWLSVEQFAELRSLLLQYCDPGTKICYRYLQKNHFQGTADSEFLIDQVISGHAEKNDRFPFYSILLLTKR